MQVIQRSYKAERGASISISCWQQVGNDCSVAPVPRPSWWGTPCIYLRIRPRPPQEFRRLSFDREKKRFFLYLG